MADGGQKFSSDQIFSIYNDILALQTDPVHPILTEFGRNILLDHTDKSMKVFLSFSKSKMAAEGAIMANYKINIAF